uniref:Uncharacterized protein n=1 Tax=Tanacetum cinerariifolium TaxID=118510 RepID=A0A6L2JY00_TANCI|nr:hypothetical protein [Tanacetum cinerariifolium]
MVATAGSAAAIAVASSGWAQRGSLRGCAATARHHMVRLWWLYHRPTATTMVAIRHPQPTTAAAAAGKAIAAAVVVAVAWEDGGTRLNGWREWRSAAEIRRKNQPEKFSGGGGWPENGESGGGF